MFHTRHVIVYDRSGLVAQNRSALLEGVRIAVPPRQRERHAFLVDIVCLLDAIPWIRAPALERQALALKFWSTSSAEMGWMAVVSDPTEEILATPSQFKGRDC